MDSATATPDTSGSWEPVEDVEPTKPTMESPVSAISDTTEMPTETVSSAISSPTATITKDMTQL